MPPRILPESLCAKKKEYFQVDDKKNPKPEDQGMRHAQPTLGPERGLLQELVGQVRGTEINQTDGGDTKGYP